MTCCSVIFRNWLAIKSRRDNVTDAILTTLKLLGRFAQHAAMRRWRSFVSQQNKRHVFGTCNLLLLFSRCIHTVAELRIATRAKIKVLRTWREALKVKQALAAQANLHNLLRLQRFVFIHWKHLYRSLQQALVMAERSHQVDNS